MPRTRRAARAAAPSLLLELPDELLSHVATLLLDDIDLPAALRLIQACKALCSRLAQIQHAAGLRRMRWLPELTNGHDIEDGGRTAICERCMRGRRRPPANKGTVEMTSQSGTHNETGICNDVNTCAWTIDMGCRPPKLGRTSWIWTRDFGHSSSRGLSALPSPVPDQAGSDYRASMISRVMLSIEVDTCGWRMEAPQIRVHARRRRRRALDERAWVRGGPRSLRAASRTPLSRLLDHSRRGGQPRHPEPLLVTTACSERAVVAYNRSKKTRTQKPNMPPKPPPAYAIARTGGWATASNCFTVYSPSQSKRRRAPLLPIWSQ